MAQWSSFWKANLKDGEAILRQALLELMRTGSEIQLPWLKASTKRTERFLGQLPQARTARAGVLAAERPAGSRRAVRRAAAPAAGDPNGRPEATENGPSGQAAFRDSLASACGLGAVESTLARVGRRTDAHRNGDLMSHSQTVDDKSPISVGGVCLLTT